MQRLHLPLFGRTRIIDTILNHKVRQTGWSTKLTRTGGHAVEQRLGNEYSLLDPSLLHACLIWPVVYVVLELLFSFLTLQVRVTPRLSSYSLFTSPCMLLRFWRVFTPCRLSEVKLISTAMYLYLRGGFTTFKNKLALGIETNQRMYIEQRFGLMLTKFSKTGICALSNTMALAEFAQKLSDKQSAQCSLL